MRRLVLNRTRDMAPPMLQKEKGVVLLPVCINHALLLSLAPLERQAAGPPRILVVSGQVCAINRKRAEHRQLSSSILLAPDPGPYARQRANNPRTQEPKSPRAQEPKSQGTKEMLSNQVQAAWPAGSRAG
jgi:hypothetical protein